MPGRTPNIIQSRWRYFEGLPDVIEQLLAKWFGPQVEGTWTKKNTVVIYYISLCRPVEFRIILFSVMEFTTDLSLGTILVIFKTISLFNLRMYNRVWRFFLFSSTEVLKNFSAGIAKLWVRIAREKYD